MSKDKIPPDIKNYIPGPSGIPRRSKKLNNARSTANNKDNSALRAKLHHEKCNHGNTHPNHASRNAVQERIDSISVK